jgi:fructose-bisphosphate aldolase class II
MRFDVSAKEVRSNRPDLHASREGERMLNTAAIISNAFRAGIVVPAFNVPYLPMVKPVVSAVVDLDSFALVEVARIEWLKFECLGPAAVMEEFARWSAPDHVRLHLDHTPVVDEDGVAVDYMPILREAIELGYHSVMVDGSLLAFEENVEATRRVVALAHDAGIPCEAELGAIAREGSGPQMPYEELYRTGMGFTNVMDAGRFVKETGCDWLSVAVGNIHGAVSAALKDRKKTEARLNLDHLDLLREVAGIPLVLHGGSGVRRDDLLAAVKRGITKVNVGFEIRQAYEQALGISGGDVSTARDAVYERTCYLIRDYFCVAGTSPLIAGDGGS